MRINRRLRGYIQRYIYSITVVIICLAVACGFIWLLKSSELNVGDSYGNSFTVESISPSYYVVYANDTKVMYTVSRLSKTRGEITLLVNADGNPCVFRDEEK